MRLFFDNLRFCWYTFLALQGAERRSKAESSTFSLRLCAKGGGADGKQAMGQGPSLHDVFYHHPFGDDLHIPKSVLTARLAPERSAI